MELSQKLVKDFFNENPLKIILYFTLILGSSWIDSLFIPKLISKLVGEISLEMSIRPILIFWITSQLFLAIAVRLYSRLMPKFNSFVRNTLLEKIFNKFQYEYTEVDLSSFISRFILTPGHLKDLVSELLQGVLPRFFVAILTLSYFIKIDKKLGITIAIIQALGIIFVSLMLQKCLVFTKERMKHFTELSSKFQDKLSNLFSVYISGRKNQEIIEGKQLVEKDLQRNTKTLSCLANVRVTSIFTNILCFIVIASTIIRKKVDKQKSTEMILTTLILLSNFYYLMISTSIITEDLGTINENEKFLRKLQTTIQPRTIEFIPGEGKIVFTNVTFAYADRQPVIKNMNLTLNPGDKIAFVGPSGSGKTTIVKLLLGFYPITNAEGKIEIDNQEPSKLSLDSLRKHITFISQNTKLFDESIYYNINYGNNKTKQEIDKYVKNVGVMRIFKNLSNGLNTKAGINGDNLSGGQKQAVHILRGFLSNNKIAILDEPTSAIDYENKKVIKDLIRKVSKNRTFILITHEDDMLDLVDKSIDVTTLA
jgi:ABC-type multidrug transport system fused ATPase/permease subunit